VQLALGMLRLLDYCTVSHTQVSAREGGNRGATGFSFALILGVGSHDCKLMRCILGCLTAVGFGVVPAICLTLVVRVQAQEAIVPYDVSTRVDPCVPIDVGRFEHLLSIELGTTTDPSAQTREPRPVATVSLTCVAGGVQLAVEDAVTRKSVARVIELEHVEARSRTRLMAVTVSELVLASWLELRLSVPETIEPAGPPAPAAVRQSAARRVEQSLPNGADGWQLSAAFGLMMFSSAPELIPSLALHLLSPLSSALALSLSVDFGWGTLNGSAMGEQALQAVTLRLRTSSLQIGLLYTAQVGDFDLSVGAGGRFGLAYLAGGRVDDSSLEPVSSYAPWGGPLLALGAAYRAGDHLRIVASLEAGIVALRARAVTQSSSTQGASVIPVAQLSGVWGIASLGIGWSH
jgi:hypothetical protein